MRDRAMAFILNIDNNYEVPSLVEPLFQGMSAKVSGSDPRNEL
jgi:hypothetical protein